MNIGKTKYKFEFNCSANDIENIINGWLIANKFEYVEKYNEKLYYHHDAFNGNRGFQYLISNNILEINAWTIGIGNKFFMLDSGAVNNMPGDSYKKALNSLFSEISKYCDNSISNSGTINNNESMQNVTNSNEDIANFSKSFSEEINKKDEKLCTIGFLLSILGLILSLFGYAFGIIIYIINFYLASRGLNTSKKVLAITTIIISILSIMIILLKLFKLL